MNEIVIWLEEHVLPHWPFVVFALVTGMVAQILKTQILTKAFAKKYVAVFWARRILPLILIAIGVVMGCCGQESLLQE